MKWIKYRQRVGEDVFQDMGIEYSEANEEAVKKIAYNGEYVIEDDGQAVAEGIPTQLDAIEAQVTYTAMMTDTLLEV